MSISISNTKSDLAVSNLTATIEDVATNTLTFHALMDRIERVSAHLDSYVLAGGDPAGLPQAVRTSEVLVNAVARLLDTDRYEFVKWDREWYMSTVAEMVMDVYAITESLDEGSYGVDLLDRMNAFMVKVEQDEDTF